MFIFIQMEWLVSRSKTNKGLIWWCRRAVYSLRLIQWFLIFQNISWAQDTFDHGPYHLCCSFGPKRGGWAGYISRKGNLHKNPSLSSNVCQWLCLASREKWGDVYWKQMFSVAMFVYQDKVTNQSWSRNKHPSECWLMTWRIFYHKNLLLTISHPYTHTVTISKNNTMHVKKMLIKKLFAYFKIDTSWNHLFL